MSLNADFRWSSASGACSLPRFSDNAAEGEWRRSLRFPIYVARQSGGRITLEPSHEKTTPEEAERELIMRVLRGAEGLDASFRADNDRHVVATLLERSDRPSAWLAVVVDARATNGVRSNPGSRDGAIETDSRGQLSISGLT